MKVRHNAEIKRYPLRVCIIVGTGKEARPSGASELKTIPLTEDSIPSGLKSTTRKQRRLFHSFRIRHNDRQIWDIYIKIFLNMAMSLINSLTGNSSHILKVISKTMKKKTEFIPNQNFERLLPLLNTF